MVALLSERGAVLAKSRKQLSENVVQIAVWKIPGFV
jgi:hypothetical protein